MASKLKEKLEADPALSVEVSTEPIPGKPIKVYKIDLDGEPFFSWEMKDGTPPPEVAVAPNDKWKTPVNFETHVKFFGEEKPWQVQELTEAIKAKM